MRHRFCGHLNGTATFSLLSLPPGRDGFRGKNSTVGRRFFLRFAIHTPHSSISSCFRLPDLLLVHSRRSLLNAAEPSYVARNYPGQMGCVGGFCDNVSCWPLTGVAPPAGGHCGQLCQVAEVLYYIIGGALPLGFFFPPPLQSRNYTRPPIGLNLSWDSMSPHCKGRKMDPPLPNKTTAGANENAPQTQFAIFRREPPAAILAGRVAQEQSAS